MGWLADETGLGKTPANFVALTPLSFLDRAADVHADRTAVVYRGTRRSYRDYHARVSRLASALARAGVEPGDVVATLLPNVPAQAEAHFGIPAAGAILNTINTRLDADTVGYIFDHGGAKVVLADTALLPLVAEAVALMQGPAPLIIEVADREAGIAASAPIRVRGFPGHQRPEAPARRRTNGKASRSTILPAGGAPKSSTTIAAPIFWRWARRSPGPWGYAGLPDHRTAFPLQQLVPHLDDAGGRRHAGLCCRDVTAKNIYDAIADEGVTHFGGAVVLNSIINAKPGTAAPSTMWSGSIPPAPPPAARWPRSNRSAFGSRRSMA